MAEHRFTVVIAGGSVAGLTLAVMLQERGIDYVVLEAYREIAPQVGASLGLLPNGLRVLDQLGVYDSILKAGVIPVDRVNMRRSNGKAFRKIENFSETAVNR